MLLAPLTPDTLEILYCDDALVAVNKPPGCMIHHGWSQGETVLVDVVRAVVGGKIHAVHRLDRATSGLVLLARTHEAARVLNAQFAAREVRKRYIALVVGDPEGPTRNTQPLSRGIKKRKPHGPRLPALTIYRSVQAFASQGVSLVEALPVTGRKHQIRRHLRMDRHPIVADKHYGYKRFNRDFRIETGLGRLALHALSLRTTHPVSQETLTLHAPIPADLAKVLDTLGVTDTTLAQLLADTEGQWAQPLLANARVSD